MLWIAAEVRPSPVDGLGLFALEPIAAGQLVWSFTEGFDLELDRRELNRLSERQLGRMLHYGYIDRELDRFVLCCDDARFINHSDHPNIATDRSVDPRGVDRALRDILAGEEITIDYGTIEHVAGGHGDR